MGTLRNNRVPKFQNETTHHRTLETHSNSWRGDHPIRFPDSYSPNSYPPMTPAKQNALDNAIWDLRKFQKQMTNEQRTDLWHDLTDGYCSACGIKLATDGKGREETCHCENDE